MDDIRELAKAIKNEEKDLLDQRLEQVNSSAFKTTLLTVVGNIFAAGLISLAAIIINQELTKRKQKESALYKNRDELEIQVQNRTAELVKANEDLTDQITQRKQVEDEIAQCKQVEKELQEITILQRAILNSANYTIICTSVDGKIVTFNAAAERLLGYTRQEVVGKTPVIFHDWDEVVQQAQELSEIGYEISPSMVAEQIALSLANLKMHSTLKNQSIRDPLTGLFNRRYMEETLERELYRCLRKQQPLSIIMIDIDHFKRFNDTFGHEAGDLVLRELSQFLQSSIRNTDIACRYGGEEFMLILPETSLEASINKS